MTGPYLYDPSEIERHFDQFGQREWDRLVATPVDEISLYLHTFYLQKHITAGMRVLEVGAGAGRFTQILARLEARVVVADLSATQLALNRKFALELDFADAVEGWSQTDICDLTRFQEASFEAVVAYGGPFSYTLDLRDTALAECLRVLKPGGILLCSVMCLWGTCRRALASVLLDTPREANQRIIASGDISPVTFPERRGHYMHLFRSTELESWLAAAGLTLLDLSASGCLGVSSDALLHEIRNQEDTWNELLRMELFASAAPGCLDMGTHLIAAARKG